MKAGPASFSAERGGGPKSDGSAAMRSGSALFEERKGGRMRLKPRAIWGMSVKSSECKNYFVNAGYASS
jgi:hypothetical protein